MLCGCMAIAWFVSRAVIRAVSLMRRVVVMMPTGARLLARRVWDVLDGDRHGRARSTTGNG